MSDQPSPLPPAAPPIPPSKTSGLSIASLVLGILGITCILPLIGALLAVVFGIIALNQISKSGGSIRGRGQAIAGLVLGGIGFVMIPILAALVLPQLGRARGPACEANCFAHVKAISLACGLYADIYNGKLPQKLDALSDFVSTTSIFYCPLAKNRTVYAYEFTGVTNKWHEDPQVVILREIEPSHNGRRTLLFDDGRVELRKE
jgi:hypothetical protein